MLTWLRDLGQSINAIYIKICPSEIKPIHTMIFERKATTWISYLFVSLILSCEI